MSKAKRAWRKVFSPPKRVQFHHVEVTALHEAAHAVVSADLGRIPTRVEITFGPVLENGRTKIGGWTSYPDHVGRNVEHHGETPPADVPSERDANGVVKWNTLYCMGEIVGALAGFAVEKRIVGEVSGSSVDEEEIAVWLDRLGVSSPEERSETRRSLEKAADTAVRESLPKISELGSELLRRVDLVAKAGQPSEAFAVAIEGEELRQLFIRNSK